jgi:predicted nucleotidyltransferase
MRQRTITKVASAIQEHFGHEYRVQVFGSTQYGVDGQTSDVDMVVVVSIALIPHLRGSEIFYRTLTEWQDSLIMSISVHYLVRVFQPSSYKYIPY